MSVVKFPSWRYGPKGEAAVFESEADVPAGWQDHPSKHSKAAPTAAAPRASRTPRAPAAPKAAKAPAKTGGKRKAKTAPLDL